MPRPKKLYKTVGKNVKIHIPQPPATATQVWLQCTKTTKAVVKIEDFDTLWGVSGWFHYARYDNKFNLKETHAQKWYWTGELVKGIEKLLEK